MSSKSAGLTQRQIERAKPGEIADPLCRGLRLIVSETGAKSWEYRYRFADRLRRIRLGQYPAVGIAEARSRWRDAQKLRNDGKDPHEERERARAEADAQRRADAAARDRAQFTVSVLVADYLEHQEKRVKGHHVYKNIAHVLHRISAAIGARPAKEVTRAECREVFEKYAATPYAANRLAQWGRAMWNWAIDRELLEVNPWARIKVHDEAPKDRALSTAELRHFLSWLPSAGDPSADILRLVLLTGCRPGEIVRAESRLVDAEAHTLTIEDTKNGTAHVVYLSDQAWRVVEGRLGGHWLFPSPSPLKVDAPPRVDTVAARLKQAIPQGMAPFTPHDLRRTIATWLGEQEQCSTEVIQRILNHRPSGVTGRHYNWAKLNQPAKRWWQAWGDHLSGLEAGNVVELRRG